MEGGVYTGNTRGAGGSATRTHETNQLLTLFDSVASSFEDGASYPAMVRLVEGLAGLRAAERGDQCNEWIETRKTSPASMS